MFVPTNFESPTDPNSTSLGVLFYYNPKETSSAKILGPKIEDSAIVSSSPRLSISQTSFVSPDGENFKAFFTGDMEQGASTGKHIGMPNPEGFLTSNTLNSDETKLEYDGTIIVFSRNTNSHFATIPHHGSNLTFHESFSSCTTGCAISVPSGHSRSDNFRKQWTTTGRGKLIYALRRRGKEELMDIFQYSSSDRGDFITNALFDVLAQFPSMVYFQNAFASTASDSVVIKPVEFHSLSSIYSKTVRDRDNLLEKEEKKYYSIVLSKKEYLADIWDILSTFYLYHKKDITDKQQEHLERWLHIYEGKLYVEVETKTTKNCLRPVLQFLDEWKIYCDQKLPDSGNSELMRDSLEIYETKNNGVENQDLVSNFKNHIKLFERAMLGCIWEIECDTIADAKGKVVSSDLKDVKSNCNKYVDWIKKWNAIPQSRSDFMRKLDPTYAPLDDHPPPLEISSLFHPLIHIYTFNSFFIREMEISGSTPGICIQRWNMHRIKDIGRIGMDKHEFVFSRDGKVWDCLERSKLIVNSPTAPHSVCEVSILEEIRYKPREVKKSVDFSKILRKRLNDPCLCCSTIKSASARTKETHSKISLEGEKEIANPRNLIDEFNECVQ
ncbi:hypothetical protein ADUPG1_012211 [Aduncisulcus paluster]|uniref:Uncharacterized protein n=1 Tax=Aduncisulcus paluster TaxID=2918883 RepID=A0ABQ5JYN0_9EUKA|nr:hypothetical protein ADUPG1_012211 [Aduncisulcus paluster]